MISGRLENFEILEKQFQNFSYRTKINNQQAGGYGTLELDVFSQVNGFKILRITNNHEVYFLTQPIDEYNPPQSNLPLATKLHVANVGKIWFDGNLLYIDNAVAIDFCKSAAYTL